LPADYHLTSRMLNCLDSIKSNFFQDERLSKYAADLALVGALVELIEAVVQNTTRHSLQAVLLLFNVSTYHNLDIVTARTLVEVVKVPFRLAKAWGFVRFGGFGRFGRLWRLLP
jgi:hypothetical protein